jgi:hypothetical protein
MDSIDVPPKFEICIFRIQVSKSETVVVCVIGGGGVIRH